MFTGKEDHVISLEQARVLVQRWRERGSALAGDPGSEFFGRDVIEKILGQPGCVGLRIHHGRNAKGQHTMLLVGADADGNELLDGTIAEQGMPCPPFCGDGGMLSP